MLFASKIYFTPSSYYSIVKLVKSYLKKKPWFYRIIGSKFLELFQSSTHAKSGVFNFNNILYD